MEILHNKIEMQRLLDNHNNAVKEQYKCKIESFINWMSLDGHEDLEAGECYIEIPSNQTKSGHAVVLDW